MEQKWHTANTDCKVRRRYTIILTNNAFYPTCWWRKWRTANDSHAPLQIHIHGIASFCKFHCCCMMQLNWRRSFMLSLSACVQCTNVHSTSTHVRLSLNLTSAGIHENRASSQCIFVANLVHSQTNKRFQWNAMNFLLLQWSFCKIPFSSFFLSLSCCCCSAYILCTRNKKKRALAFNANIHTITNVNLLSQHLSTLSFHFVSFFVLLHFFTFSSLAMQSVGNWAKSCTKFTLSSQWKQIYERIKKNVNGIWLAPRPQKRMNEWTRTKPIYNRNDNGVWVCVCVRIGVNLRAKKWVKMGLI